MRLLFFILAFVVGFSCNSQPIKVVASNKIRSSTAFKSTYNLTFNTNTDISNTNQIFTAAGGAFGYGHTGVDDLYIPAGQTGRIYYKVTNAGATDNIFCLDTVKVNHGYANFFLGVDVNSGSLEFFEVQNGFFASGYTVSTPSWIGVYRAGANMKVQVSNNGNEWTDLNIYRGSYNWYSSDTLWPVVDMYSTARLDSPRIDIYSRDKTDKLYLSNGNSIAHGALPAGALSTASIGSQGWYALDGNSEWLYNDNAVNGQSISAAITAFSTVTKPQLVHGFSKILISYLEGTNQLIASTAPAAFLLMREYIDSCLAQRPEVQMMIYMTPSANPSVGFTNARRNEFNDSLATLPAKYPGRVLVVDIRGDAIVDGALSYANAIYYWDGVHLTQTGYDYLASLGAAVLVTFGFEKYVIFLLLFAAVATKVEAKVVSMNKVKKAA